MEQAAEKLDQSGWPTNHPQVEMNLPTFRRDFKFAREAIEREPPNYLLAATVTGACVHLSWQESDWGRWICCQGF